MIYYISYLVYIIKYQFYNKIKNYFIIIFLF